MNIQYENGIHKIVKLNNQLFIVHESLGELSSPILKAFATLEAAYAALEKYKKDK